MKKMLANHVARSVLAILSIGAPVQPLWGGVLATNVFYTCEIECVYPRIELGRNMVLLLAYSNNTPSAWEWHGPFFINRDTTELAVDIVCGTSPVKRVSRANAEPPIYHDPFRQDPHSVMVRDVVIPAEELPDVPGKYHLIASFHTPVYFQGAERRFMGKAPPIPFEVVAAGTPTTERPRPWGEYKDSKLYQDWKRFVVTMPPHRLEGALTAAFFGKTKMHDTLVRTFCDPTVPDKLRLQVVLHVTPGFLRNDDLLKVALSEKESKDIRDRAISLIGMMQDNSPALAELKKHSSDAQR